MTNSGASNSYIRFGGRSGWRLNIRSGLVKKRRHPMKELLLPQDVKLTKERLEKDKDKELES